MPHARPCRTVITTSRLTRARTRPRGILSADRSTSVPGVPLLDPERCFFLPRSEPIHNECVVVPLTPSVPSTTEIATLYGWILDNRHCSAVAYRVLSLSRLVPTPNQSHRTTQSIADWCDTQIDAFTLWLVGDKGGKPLS